MKHGFALSAATVLAACFAASALAGTTINVQFEDAVAGTHFENADLPTSFVTEGVTVLLTDPDGHGYANASIGTANYSGSTGNELCLWAGAMAELDLGYPSTGGYFYFADLGGNNDLQINGSSIDFDDIRATSMGSVGGVSYNSNHLSGSAYSVKLAGIISTLSFQGQELAIDRVALTLVPEPSCLALLLGALITVVSGRRRR